MTRQILADFDDSGVIVYQAFRPETVAAAVARGTFGKGFSLDRMTWIKPSFGWMLYRSGYATKHRQEAIARVRLSHEGFRAILGRAVPTWFIPGLFADEVEWQTALANSGVRYQWDPDRYLHLHRLERRALQLGMEGDTVRQYVHEWILGVEDATALAHAVRDAVGRNEVLPAVPEERVYPVQEALARRLGMS
jgi:hypothetical protein